MANRFGRLMLSSNDNITKATFCLSTLLCSFSIEGISALIGKTNKKKEESNAQPEMLQKKGKGTWIGSMGGSRLNPNAAQVIINIKASCTGNIR